jgi:hypothetical protein
MSSTMGRFIRCLFIVAGSSATGVSLGALGTYALLSVMLPPVKQDGWGAAPIWMLLIAIGSVIGLIAGLAMALGRIGSSDFSGYSVFEWLGVLLGVAAGVGLTFLLPERDYWIVQCIVGGLTVPTCATLGRWLFGDVIGTRLVARSRPLGRRDD